MTDQPEPASGATRLRVRRAPRLPVFLGVGVVLGMITGFLIDYLGPDPRCAELPPSAGPCVASYDVGASLAYFLVLGALAGLAVGATVAVIVERAMERR